MSTHHAAQATCAACPKACRSSCPISEATANEALSAWGKMTTAHHVAKGWRAMTPETSRSVHACTGCGRCTSACAQANGVGPALFAARGAAVEHGVAPAGAASTAATFGQSGNPFGGDLASRAAARRPTSPVRYTLFPGCTALEKRPEVVDDAVKVAGAFGAPMGVTSLSASCCGYPLYAAGHVDAFRAHAAQVRRLFDEAHDVAVLDPGCAHTLLVVYPSLGVPAPRRVRTVVDVLAENVPHAPKKPPLDETVGYHDACRLGRGLGQYEQPRSLVRLAVKNMEEAPSTRAEGGCAGGGGLLPRTMPEVAVEVARRQAAEVSAAAAVVTACPTSQRMFERAGRPSYDVVSLLRRWLEEP